MDGLVARRPDCDRAREAVSRRLDGELSELEGRRLRAHLERCAACRSFESDVSAFTAEMRAAAPEAPSHPIPTLRRPPRLAALTQLRAAAALILVVMGVGTVLGPLGSSEPTLRETAVAVLEPDEELRMLRLIRREALVQEGMARPPRQGAQP